MTVRINLSDLIAKKAVFNKLIEEKVVHVAQKITTDVHRNVVIGSPVDTGTFRGAWTVETPQKPFENGKVENTTAYGPYLVHGHSKQAPDGWIDNAIEAATRLGGK
ncbi:HK97 gp10 family phage protein [Sphingomonas sp. G-3-2-10]|uniref:HK97 gp10 family phage protein n=1 Tax=Sphingomonas sp. G-3-2-10 TaxID=2728838 RepID=UPI00146E6D91|nr:HK97 gp10 family phage protein [Sphingomonas sp. G-3-2-10]NML04272.1 HK97 gp10 family phage protein [Sphingomonas sp. G-3-2-10]